MKKICYTCEHYGKCTVNVSTCTDWIKYTGKAVCNTAAFNTTWQMLHKKWYWRLDPDIEKQRQMQFNIAEFKTEFDLPPKETEND